MILNRDQILAAQDVKTERVPVPEWGGEVLVRGLTGTERDAFEESLQKTSYANFRASLAAVSIVGEDGKPLFSKKDVDILGKKSAAALDRVFEVAQRLSGFGKKEIEQITGNSEPGQRDDSISA